MKIEGKIRIKRKIENKCKIKIKRTIRIKGKIKIKRNIKMKSEIKMKINRKKEPFSDNSIKLPYPTINQINFCRVRLIGLFVAQPGPKPNK